MKQIIEARIIELKQMRDKQKYWSTKWLECNCRIDELEKLL